MNYIHNYKNYDQTSWVQDVVNKIFFKYDENFLLVRFAHKTNYL